MPATDAKIARMARHAAHEQPEWSNLSGPEVEELVGKLAREGKTTAVIGVILRDQFAVPDIRAATGKRVSDILSTQGLAPQVPEDLANLIRRASHLREHLRDHQRDLHNRRGLQLIESRVRRLVKYYKTQGTLPYEWKYSVETAKLLVE